MSFSVLWQSYLAAREAQLTVRGQVELGSYFLSTYGVLEMQPICYQQTTSLSRETTTDF